MIFHSLALTRRLNLTFDLLTLVSGHTYRVTWWTSRPNL